jgi:hypothetical protein
MGIIFDPAPETKTDKYQQQQLPRVRLPEITEITEGEHYHVGLFSQRSIGEDATGAISESVNWLKKFDSVLSSNHDAIRNAVKVGDAVKTSKLMRELF